MLSEQPSFTIEAERPAMRFETSDPSVDWMNRILALARGQQLARAGRLDAYGVL